jgi:hypothetical protein
MARHERDVSVTHSDDDQLRERELLTANADLLAFPKLTCINTHALASLSGRRRSQRPLGQRYVASQQPSSP